jgi:sulfocyanin
MERALRWGGALGAVVAVAAMVPGTPVLGAAMHSVDVSIVAGKNAGDGGFDFNGYQRGGMTVTVPTGWRVVLHFENVSTLAHSLIVLPSSGAQQAAPSGPPAFPGAMTKDLSAGLANGTKTTLTFTASKPGTYAFVCGVPGHAVAGMWDKLVVSDAAKAPSVTPAGAAAVTAK